MSRQAPFYGLLIVTFLLALIVPITPAPADPGGIPHVPGEVIIKYKVNTTQLEKAQVRGEVHGTKEKEWGRIRAELNRLDGITVEEAIQRLSGHPKVEYVEPNYILEMDEVPNDPMFDQLWGMENTGQTGGTAGADISATNAWDVFTGSGSVIIGVIDTGVDYNHPDLAANIWTNPGEIPGNGIDDDGNGFVDDIHGWDFYNDDSDPMDDNGHGSHCSGTIGGVGNNGIGVAGVNWNVKIMALKFLSGGGSGSTADAIDAVNYAVLMGAHLTSNSWGGGGFSQGLYDAIEAAGDAGQLFVAAAGNSSSNTDVSPHYPSSYDLDNIVAVAATDHNDQLASFSSYGATTVDLAAPGVDILSTLPGNQYGVYSGTSMATPHVAGALGLVFGRLPGIGHLDAKNLLMNFTDPIPAMAGKCVTEGRLNAFFPIADPDSIPPAEVTDLAVTDEGSNWLTLDWTAPGDDGLTGTASRYDMRYSTAPIDAMNFEFATQVTGEPDPGMAGTPETMTVDGLDFSTTYYFAVVAKDEFGNTSPLSNVAAGTTLGPPDVAAAPTSFTETLITGATSTQSLLLSNLAPNTTLDFDIPLPDLVTSPVAMADYQAFGKGEFDPRSGDPVLEGTGGPDGFGYRWVDSDEPFGPAFAWTDISGTGAVAISTGDDTNTGPFPIGFDFSYYGVTYSQFRVCSNGFLSFTSSSTAYGNQGLPNPGAPAAMIAPFWDDLDTGGGDVFYESDGSRLIVQWNNVNHYGSGGPYTFQAILYSDGTIEFQYLSMGSPDNSATVGMQNSAATDGLQIAFNTTYIHDALAVRIQAVPQWVTVTPGSGTIWGVGDANLDVGFDASGLLGGTYEGNIRIMSNDPVDPMVTLPVTLTVIGAPDIAVEPASYDFGQVFLGGTPTADILVRNPGTDTLHVSNVGFSDGVYTADATSFDIPPRSSRTVVVTFAPVVVGSYPATMTVTSDDPDQPTVDVSLAGEGVVPPDFAVSPTSLTSDLLTGQSEIQTLTIVNTGGADLEFDVSVDLGITVEQFADWPEVGKGEADPGVGILGSGGPDVFGYQWIDSDEVGGPVFDWTDISTVGTPIYSGNSDDGNYGPFPIGFDFSFYGNTFSDFRVCSNGFLSFTSSSGDYSNAPLPGTGAPENLLAVFHDDMYVDADIPSQVFYYNDGARLIVQWDQIRRLGQSDTSPPFYTFQAILYPNGTILYQYLTVGTLINSATVGIQNDARDDGLTVAYNTDYVHDGLAIRFAAAPEWLSANPLAGVVPPGGSQNIDVRFNADGLFGGRYEGGVDIATNDPVAPNVHVPATLNVTGAPDIDVDPLALSYGDVYVGYPEGQSFTISNTGTDLLTVSAITSDNPDFVVDLTGYPLPLQLLPLQSAQLGVNFSPSAPGPQTGNVTVSSDDADEAAVVIALDGNGLIPPQAWVDPTAMSADMLTGETEMHYFTLYNGGGSDLDFEVQALTAFGVSTEVYNDWPEVAKGETDPGIGILGSGGPDAYGYEWKDSDEPNGPVFDWVDISGVGTPIYSGNADDSNRGPFPIGFDFSFYGNLFNTFRVSSNGFISFTSTLSDLSNSPLPGTGSPENLLAVFHDDMYVDADIPSQVYYYNDGSRLIVQFDQIRRYGQSDTSPPFYTFQAILYPNGTIIYQYLTVGTLINSATIGIQNDARDDGLTVVYNDDYVHDGLAIRIATSPEWLGVNPAAGTLAPGENTTINVRFNATGMFGGDYAGEVQVLSNDPANGLLVVDCAMHVTGVPRVGWEPEPLDFGTLFVGYPDTLDLIVTNVGTDLLSVTSLTPGLADYSVDPASFDLDPLASQTVRVAFAPTTDGDRSTTLTIVSNDPDSPHSATLVGHALNPPVITTEPETVVGAAPPGGQKTKTLTVCNEGGSDLIYQVNASETMTTQVYDFVQTPKGKDEVGGEEPVDPRPGILGSGGPDMFGYTWTDSDEPGGPVYDWVDISGIGTPLGLPSYRDDGNYGPYPIGFDFPFYGNSFGEFNFCTNGWLSFTSTLSTYSNQPLPNGGSSVPENLLAVYWDDMVYDEGDDSYAYYHYDGSRLIVQFQIRRIATFSPPWYECQVILYPNGDIVYQYRSLGSNTTSVTIGIQNDAKDDGLTVAYNTGYVHTDMAIKFSSAPAWLSVSPESGVIPAGECVDLSVLMDAAALAAGDYYGDITITSNDPATPVDVTPVVFHVAEFEASWVDIDPNTLNLDSNGNFVTAYVEFPLGYDPNDIVLETVMFNGTVPALRMSIGDENGNGIPDAMFKFDRALVEDILESGESVEVCVTGEVMDTAWFFGCDHIRVIRPKVLTPNGGGYVATGSPVGIIWENPVDWTVDYCNLYYSLDGGQNWSVIAEQVTGEFYEWIVPMETSENALIRIYALDNQGVMGYDTSDEVFEVTAALDAGRVTPRVFALLQNSPNPFQGATRIRFDLPQESWVNLKVYDVSGRVVRVLREGLYPADTYEVSWDGQNEAGTRMAAGIYFYRLQAGDYTATKRMFLRK